MQLSVRKRQKRDFGIILFALILLLSFPQISGASESVELTVTQGLIPSPYSVDFVGPPGSWWYFSSDSEWIKVAFGWWWTSQVTVTIYPGYNGATGVYNGTVTATNCRVDGQTADGSSNVVCTESKTLYTLNVVPPNISVSATSFDAEVTACLSKTFPLTVESTGSVGQSNVRGGGYDLVYYRYTDADWIAPLPYADFEPTWNGQLALREGKTGVVNISISKHRIQDWSIGERRTGNVYIGSGDTFFNIPVTLTVVEPKISVSPEALYLEVKKGEKPPSLTLTVTNTGNKGDGWLYYWLTVYEAWMNTTMSGFRTDRWDSQPHLGDGDGDGRFCKRPARRHL